MHISNKEHSLEELGYIHGRWGKQISDYLYAGLSERESAAYFNGLYRGSKSVENNPTVDNRHLQLSA